MRHGFDRFCYVCILAKTRTGQNVGDDHGESSLVCTGYRVGRFERHGLAGADTGSFNGTAGSHRGGQDRLYPGRKMRSSADPPTGGTLGVWRRRLFRPRSLLRARLLWITWDPLALVSLFRVLTGRLS